MRFSALPFSATPCPLCHTPLPPGRNVAELTRGARRMPLRRGVFVGRFIFHAVGSWNKWNAMVGMLIQCQIPLPALVAEVDAAGWLQSPSRAAVDLPGGGGGRDRAGSFGGDGRCQEQEERAETQELVRVGDGEAPDGAQVGGYCS
jgi:hypothetical protein